MTQTHRYFTIPHQMEKIEPQITGSYLNSPSQKAALAPASETQIEIERESSLEPITSSEKN